MSDSKVHTTPTRLADAVVVRPDPSALAGDRLSHFVGVSASSADSQEMAMALVVIPPGAVAEPHIHPNHETVVYLLRGQVELRWGDGLQNSVICQAGDFVFTPAGVPHQPRNLSATEPVYGVAARTDANESEHSVPYFPEV